MTPQDQCCSLEQAGRLKEMGIDGDSLFTWEPFGWPEPWQLAYPSHDAREYRAAGNPVKWIPAWTVAELGELLPNGYDTMRVTAHTPHLYMWRGYDPDGKDCPGDKGYRTEAEARAAMLIHLLENNLITAEAVNARLKNP